VSTSYRRPRFGGRHHTATVIEARVHRSSARNARAAFCLTLVVVTAAAAVIASASMHPILAALLGVVVGGVTSAIVWALVRAWPVFRLIWWWLPEVGLVLALSYGWVQLATHTTLVVRSLVVGLGLILGLIPPVRRRLAALAWCVIVRHRLRVCFAQFIIANQSGSLPLILLARPTPVGERVWIYLRPGLSHADLTARLDKVAVACHAASVIAERASERTAAYVRLDIKRREVLTTTVTPPVADLVPAHTTNGGRVGDTTTSGLDLPDIPAPTRNGDRPAGVRRILTAVRPAATPAAGATPPASSAASAPANGAANGAAVDDITDWI
jgi:hypothetical protein